MFVLLVEMEEESPVLATGCVKGLEVNGEVTKGNANFLCI